MPACSDRMSFQPQCLVIEDSVAGVLGAVSAGMAVFGFVSRGHSPTARCTATGSPLLGRIWSLTKCGNCQTPSW